MRLIDADELKKMFMYAEDAECSKWSLSGVISEIDDMPTVCDIEDIKADIEAARYGLINDGLDVALRIIDKHIEGR